MKIEGREKVGDGGEWLLVDSTVGVFGVSMFWDPQGWTVSFYRERGIGYHLTRSWLLETREEAVIRRDLCLTDIAEMETTHILTMLACAIPIGLSIALMCGASTVFYGWVKVVAIVIALFSSCAAFLIYFSEKRTM